MQARAYPTGRYCPRCSYPLHHAATSMVWVDHCYRCGGSFLELGKAGKAVGEHADPSKWRVEAFARPPAYGHLFCPFGHGRMVSYHMHSEGKHVEIDACPACHGLWLDAREAGLLAAITTEVHHEHARPGSSKGKIGVAAVYLLQLATMLPVEAYNPVKRKPHFIHATVVLLAVIFGIEMVLMGSGAIDPFIKTFGLVPADVARGNAISILTHAFLHGSTPHLLGNLYFLWIFGDNVEDLLGTWRALVLYVVSGISGGLLYLVFESGSRTPLVGASGAIAGLMGAYLVLFPKVRLWVVIFFAQFKIRALWYMFIWLGLQVLIMLDPKSNVSWHAHLGGFAAGVGLAFALRRSEPVPGAAAR
ncbi:MAG: rhomboid family intramembrane serine protease [Myxococcales bacterium]|nr:rhomboid family intramembrane serine protease [Myxococcales bacterium]